MAGYHFPHLCSEAGMTISGDESFGSHYHVMAFIFGPYQTPLALLRTSDTEKASLGRLFQ